MAVSCSGPKEEARQGPFEMTMVKTAKWTEGHEGYDAEMNGYHITGDIAKVRIRPLPGKTPEKIVLAITTSPSMRPMLEHFQVTTSEGMIQSATFDGLDYDSVTDKTGKETGRAKRGEYFKYEVVGREARVTFMPKAMELLKGECEVEWIDWYRK